LFLDWMCGLSRLVLGFDSQSSSGFNGVSGPVSQWALVWVISGLCPDYVWVFALASLVLVWVVSESYLGLVGDLMKGMMVNVVSAISNYLGRAR
jgi:hypothetical protein